MNEVQMMKFLFERIEGKVNRLIEIEELTKKAEELADEDEKNGKKYTLWVRKEELGIAKAGSSRSEVKDSLKLLRKISLELEKRL